MRLPPSIAGAASAISLYVPIASISTSTMYGPAMMSRGRWTAPATTQTSKETYMLNWLEAILTGFLAVFGLADAATLSGAKCDVQADDEGELV